MTLYNGILARIEALGERPDIATLDSIDRTLEEVFATRPTNGGPTRAYTRSLDAALALCERVLPGSWCKVTKYAKRGGWAEVGGADTPDHYNATGLTPALALLTAMLRAKISQEDAADVG